MPPDLQADLDRLDAAGIPRDIVFEQGVSVLFEGRDTRNDKRSCQIGNRS